MNTFLPFPDFAASAQVLDRQRLGKQRPEVLQLLAATTGWRVVDGVLERVERPGWGNHPAALMWRGFGASLARYGLAVCAEWVSRGYRDTCADKIRLIAGVLPKTGDPEWLGDEDFHLAHRSNLVRKDRDHYGALWPDVPADLPYVWPGAALAA